MENERPIEKLLRRYAKKRSDEASAPPKLHPATRRLLQSEVKRRYPQGHSAGGGTRFWPRFKLAVAILALLAVVAIFIPDLRSSKREGNKLMALNQPVEQPAAKRELDIAEESKTAGVPAASIASPLPATPPASAIPEIQTADASVASDGRGGASVSGYVSATNGILPPVTESPSEPPSFPVAGPIVTAGQTVALSDNTRTAPRGLKSAAGFTDSFKYTNNLASAGEPSSKLQAVQQNISQRFMNNAVVDKDLAGAKTANAVLSNFNCVQDGDHLIVVDGDGSTYSGSIELNQAVATFAGGTRLAEVDRITSQAPQNYFFHVIGTNLTLNTKVVFTGNFAPQTITVQAQSHAAVQQVQNTVQPPSQSLLQNSTIVGTARVGDQIVVNVNAVPVSQK